MEVLVMQLGLSMSLSQHLDQQLQLSQSQKLSMRNELRDAMGDKPWHPKAVCHFCSKRLTNEEILKGFLDDPNDTTTECPKCKQRFQPLLTRWESSSEMSLMFYCELQTLDRLQDMERLNPNDIRSKNASLYESALSHFGSLSAAFKRLGIKYARAQKAWKDKVRPFLGDYPDALIAECVGVSRSSVQKYRTDLGIGSWA